MPAHHRPEVDGLRALAIVPVVLFHAGIEVFRGGIVGVDIFFVISGFLITGILLKENAARSFSITRLDDRRARPILPFLVVVAIVCYLVG